MSFFAPDVAAAAPSTLVWKNFDVVSAENTARAP
jgi:hypothetical protein